MFDAIAPRYDFLNHVLSAGIDRRWRRRMIASLRLTGRETLVDVCTGTADVPLEARRGAGPRPSGTAARVLGVSEATIYTWKSKYGALEVSEARRLKALEDENRRLKSLVADLSLDKEVLKAVISKNGWSLPV